MHNLLPQVLLPIQRNAKTTKKQEHSPKSASGVHGYGSKTKLSQVYPYALCEIFAACLSRFLGRDLYASHLSVVIDLLQYSGDSCLVGLLTRNTPTYLSDNPLKESKLLQDNNVRSLATTVNSLPSKTKLLVHHAKPSLSLDALVKDVTHLRTPNLFPSRHCL